MDDPRTPDRVLTQYVPIGGPMNPRPAALTSLLAATAILLVGHGLQLTLLPLRAEALGWSATLIGYTGSAYFAGFVFGCFLIPRWVARVGHVRVFMVLTAGASSALLAVGLSETPPAWLVARFATGVCLAGLYLVIESWLNEQVSSSSRGSLLSIYTGIVLVAMIGGQQLAGQFPSDGQDIVLYGAMLLGLAAVPVGLTRASVPAPVAESNFSVATLFSVSHVATGAALFTGMTQGMFYALAPFYAQRAGFDTATAALLISTWVLGGAICQYPLGRLSDRVDRRYVILATLLLGTAVCSLGAVFGDHSRAAAFACMFLFGAAVVPIYPLCLAHANDNTETGFLENGTAILMINSIGSIIGPILGAVAMSRFGPHAFYATAALTVTGAALWTLVFLNLRTAEKPYFAPFSTPAPTTPGALAIDPRSDDTDPPVERDPTLWQDSYHR